MLDVVLEPLALRGQGVGEENIGRFRDFVQELNTLRRRDVDADTALAAVGMLHQGIAAGIELHAAHIDETPLGIAPHRVLDLDDVRAPVGQDRSRRGNERELGDLQDSYALHYLRHRTPLYRALAVGETPDKILK